MRLNAHHSGENIDPELQWAIDNSYRTNPELRDDILDSLEDEELESYIVNVEHGDVKLKAPPEQILQKLTGLSDLGNIVTTMRGGNGVAVLTDKDLVIKITGDKAEYITSKELENINSEYVVKVHSSKVIDPDDQSIYTPDSKPAYLIIMDKVDAPTIQQERDWFDCGCTEDKPIYIDFTDPDGDAVVHPPVDDYDKCNKIYDDIMNIRKEIERVGRRWVDIGIDNVGIKDGKYVLIDLGTNDPLPLNENTNTLTKKLKESITHPTIPFTSKVKRILQVALDMGFKKGETLNLIGIDWKENKGAAEFRKNLSKFFDINLSLSHDLSFIFEYNIKIGNEKVSTWVLPTIYESNVYVYGDYDTHYEYTDCDETGISLGPWAVGEECECERGTIYDSEDDEYRACTESELDTIHSDEECECEYWANDDVVVYYYPIYETQIYSTVDPETAGCDHTEHTHLSDYIHCLESTGDVVRVMSEMHISDTAHELEDDFDYGLGQEIADDSGRPWSSVEFEEHNPSVEMRRLNDLYPDSTPTSEKLNEQQMTMFPTGHWRFPVGKEGEAVKEIQEQLPEHIVKLIFQQWDKEEPLQMNDKDFKLFGIPHKVRLLIALIVRYLQNTTRPIPVRRVWDCEDLKYLFTKEDRHIVQKYLCEEDFDYEMMYGYDEWDDGMPDQLDEKSWGLVTKILGVDESIAENLLKDNPQTQAEEELLANKEDDVDTIRYLLKWSNERGAGDATYTAIKDSMKDEIEDHFEQEGKFEYNSKGELVYIIEADLKDYVQDPNAWDNTDRFQSHEDFSGLDLEDILYDINLESDSTLNPYTSSLHTIPNVIFDIFMVSDFSTQWYSDKHELTVDTKFFDSYWYPDYDINQDFMDRMGEAYYDQLKGTMNEGKSYGAEIELDHNNAYIEAGPITKTEIQILNMIMGKFSQQELTDLTTIDYHNVGLDLEIKWSNFIKLIGEKTGNSEDFAKSTRWAKWVLDNRDRAEGANEDGEVVIDFNNIDILTRNYPSVYEVEGDESIWQREYRRAAVEIPAFDDEDARERANASFWEYDPEFETYDYGNSDTDEFNIEDITHYQTLKEQIINTENLPEEEISPDLVEGDKVFVWDVEPDFAVYHNPAPPGTTPNTIPSAFIGTVTEVIPDDEIDRHAYRGGIKYMVDSMSGLIGLYPGRSDGLGEMGRWGFHRDKWVKLNKENLQEIKKITNTKNIERQKDFTLKRSFMESINNLTEKEITTIKESVVVSRVTLFDYLDELSKSSLVNENELPELLIGGRNWTDKFTVSKSMDLDDLKENSNKVRDIVFNNAKLKLSKKLENPSFIETKRELLETAKSIVTLWEESRRNKNRVS